MRSTPLTFNQAQRRLSLWFVLPGFLLVFVIMTGVALYSFDLSFRDLDLARGYRSSYVGFETYRDVLSRRETVPVIRNTVHWIVVSATLVIVLGIFAGYAVSSDRNRFVRYSRSIMLVPWILPGVVVAGLWRWMFNSQNGLINKILVDIGVLSEGFSFLGTPETVLFSVEAVIIWRLFPIFALVVASAIQSIDNEIFEAGMIDGINRVQEFLYIIMPSIKYQVLTMGVTVLIWIANNLVLVNVMTGGGPLFFSQTLPVYMFKLGFQFGRLSQAAVVTVLNLVILGFFSAIYLVLYRRGQKADR